MKTTNRNKGNQLELFVAEILQEIYNEQPPIRPTKASGGGLHNTEIGDINSQRLFVECKAHKDKFFSRKIWEKLINSLPLGSNKIPIYVVDDSKDKLVMLSFNDFCLLLKEMK
jgi:hypothetical protein